MLLYPAPQKFNTFNTFNTFTTFTTFDPALDNPALIHPQAPRARFRLSVRRLYATPSPCAQGRVPGALWAWWR